MPPLITLPSPEASDTLSKATESGIRIESTSKLAKKVAESKTQLINALTDSDFYVQLIFCGVAITLAWLVSLLIRRRLGAYLKANPPRHIELELLQRSLYLITPMLSVLYLGVIKPFSDDYAVGLRSLAQACIHLSVAYMLARLVLLLVQTRPVANLLAFLIMLTAVLKVTAFTQITVGYLDSVAIDIGSFHISLLNLVNGGIIMVLVFWISGGLSRWLEKFLRRTSSLSYSARELTVKFFRIFLYFMALLVTLSAVGVDLTAFAVFGGALGVGIGLGLQKITANFVSGITLLLEKSIKIGDLIDVAGNSGWVRELNIRYTLIETGDGREILIPNEELVSSRVTNWTHSNTNIRVDIEVGVNYDADPRLVRRLLLEAAREYKLTLKDPEPLCHLRKFGESSLGFYLMFWIPNVHDGRFGPQSEVMIAILDKFRANNIEIPYPQRVVRSITETIAHD